MNRASALLILIVIFVFMSVPATGEDMTPAGGDMVQSRPLEIDELEEAIRILDNPGEAKKLASQLRALVEAKKLARKKEEEKRPSPITDKVYEFYESQASRVSRVADILAATIKNSPSNYGQLRSFLSEKANQKRFFSLALRFCLIGLAGLVAWILFRRLSKRMQAMLSGEAEESAAAKSWDGCVRTMLEIIPWTGIYLFIYIVLLFFPFSEAGESLLLRGILTFIVYKGASRLLYFLLSPERGAQRAIVMRDDLAHYILTWAGRVLLFSFWMAVLAGVDSAYAGTDLRTGIVSGYYAGLVAMVAIVLAQRKESIVTAIHWNSHDKDSDWKRALKSAFNYIGGKLYIAAILYMSIVAALSILGFPDIQARLLASTVETLLVLVFAALAWLFWEYLFDKLFKAADVIKGKFPELERQVNLYVKYMEKGGYMAVSLLAVFVILEIWGLPAYEFLLLNSGIARVLARVPLIILASVFLVHAAGFLIGLLEKQVAAGMLAGPGISPLEIEKRVSTLGGILRRVVFVAVVTVAAMMIFDELGFDIKPILAGAGILGLAVGFGAQNLVRDIISGLFLIVENRIRVGDVAVINGSGGLVEQVNLRTTVLRDLSGTVHVFPNGCINTLANMTHEFSYYVFDVGVAYKEDVDRVIAVLKEIGEEITGDAEFGGYILEPMEVLGVDRFGESEVVIKARLKTLPIKQWIVGREMNRRIKNRFDKEGIEIPFPHRTIYFGDPAGAADFTSRGRQGNADGMKELIRDVIREMEGRT